MKINTCQICEEIFGKVRLRGSTTECKKCQNLRRAREWKREHPERAREMANKFDKEKKRANDKARNSTPESLKKIAIKQRRHYHKDIEVSRQQSRDYYSNNRDKMIQKTVDRSDRIIAATPPWANQQIIASIYSDCRRITRETGIQHHVDHIVPLRGEIVSGLHVHTNLRIITAKENQEKSNKILEELIPILSIRT